MKKIIKIWLLSIVCAIPITIATVYELISNVDGILFCLIGAIILYIALED